MGTSFRQFPAASKKSCLPKILRGLRRRLCGSGLVDTGLGQDINLAEPEALAVVQPPQGRTFQHLIFISAIGQLVIIQAGVAAVPAILFHHGASQNPKAAGSSIQCVTRLPDLPSVFSGSSRAFIVVAPLSQPTEKIFCSVSYIAGETYSP